MSEQSEQLRVLWDAGTPVATIGQVVGLTKDEVEVAARGLGLKPIAREKGGWTEARVEAAKRMKAAGKTHQAIADALGAGITEKSVKNVFANIRAGREPVRRGLVDWTEDKIATLVVMWRANAPSSAIGAAIQVSPGALAGKIATLRKAGIDLPARATGKPPAPLRIARTVFRGEGATDWSNVKRGPVNTEPSARELAIAAGLPPTDKPLSFEGCRWPIGDPRAINSAAFGTFRTCRQEKAVGSYCAAHAEIARSGATWKPEKAQ